MVGSCGIAVAVALVTLILLELLCLFLGFWLPLLAAPKVLFGVVPVLSIIFGALLAIKSHRWPDNPNQPPVKARGNGA